MPAGALGSLVVALEANTASFEAAMGRMDYLAGKMADGVKAKIGALDATFIGLANKGVDIAINKIGDAIESLGPAAVNAAAHLERMRQTLGGTVEGLSAITAVAKLSGTSVESLDTGMTRLAKAMTGSDNETKGAGLAFAALGVQARDATGNLRPTEDVMKDIAVAFDGFQDGAGKAAAAQMLFGRAGAQLLPVLHDMAIAGDLVGKVTAEQARQAEEYEKNLKRLQAAKEALVRTIALELVPVLNAFAEALLEAQKQSGSLRDQVGGLAQDGSIRAWAESTAMAIATVVDVFRDATTVIVAFVDGLGAQGAILSSILNAIGGAALFATGHFREGLRVMVENLRAVGSIAQDWSRQMSDALEKPADAARRSVQQIFDAMRSANVANAIYGATGNAYGASLYDTGKPKLNIDTSGLNDALKVSNELNDVLNKIAEKTSGFSKDFAKSMAILAAGMQSGQISVLEYTRAVGLLIEQQPVVQAGFKRQAELQDYARKYTEAQTAAYAAALAIGDQIIEGVDSQMVAMQAEIDTVGMSSAEREKYNIKLRTSIELKKALSDPNLREEDAEDIRKQIDARQAALLQLVDQRTELQNQKTVWDDIANRGGQFFSDLVENGTSAFRRLGESLKKFALDMIALFAKRFILQIAAAITGSSALSLQAASLGANTLGGPVLGGLSGINLLGGLGGFSLSGAGISQGIGLATGNIGAAGYFGGFGANMALAGSSLTSGSIGTAIGAVMPYLIPAILGIAAISSLFGGHQDATRSGYFGTSPTGQYNTGIGTGTSAFGTFGIFNDQWFSGSEMNQTLQQFIAGLAQLDNTMASFLTPAEVGRVSGALNTSHQYGFGTEHTDFGATLGEITIDRVREIFNAIDPSLTALLDGFKGTGEELGRFAVTILQIRSSLREMNISGLDITSLQAMERNGETLQQTFTRVGQGWAFFTQNFTTDAERLSLAQSAVNATFSSLGVAVPQTREDFAALVRGLDLSTDSGRRMFQALMDIAPAFLDVSNAAAQAAQQSRQAAEQMNQAAQGFAQAAIALHGGMGGALGREWARGQLEVAAQHWLDLAGNDSGLQTVATVIANIPTIDPAAALGFAEQLGPEGVAALTTLFNAYNAWQAALNSGTQGITTFTNAVNTAGVDLLKQVTIAKASLGDYLQSLLTNQSLSPLDLSEQLGVLGRRFDTLVTAAQGGDLTAFQNISGASQQYLNVARQLFASSPQYVDIFKQVYDRLAGVAGVKDYNATMLEINKGQAAALKDIYAMLIGIRDNAKDQSTEMIAATMASAAAISGAIQASSLGQR